MKGKKLIEWFTSKKIVTSCAAIALAAVIGGVSLFSGTGEAPEFPSYTDPVMETSIQEEETPLSIPAEDLSEDHTQNQDNEENR